MFIKTDAKGNMYYETADGKKIAVNPNSLKQEIIIMKDNGEMLVRGKDGKIQKPEFDAFGQPFVRNAKGEKVYLNKG